MEVTGNDEIITLENNIFIAYAFRTNPTRIEAFEKLKKNLELTNTDTEI